MKAHILFCATLLAGLAACVDEPEHTSVPKASLGDTAQAAEVDEAQKARDEADRKWEQEKAELAAQAARDTAAEEANPHYDVVMQVAGLEHETTIYSHLTAIEAKAKWLTLSSELNSGHRFFTVDDPSDVTASLMVRPEQIIYITINSYKP